VRRNSALFTDFLRGTKTCRDLFPASALSVERAIERRERESAGILSDDDVAEITSWNVAVSNDGAGVVENIRALRDPKTLVVATGQQAGLFLGPLYTMYKTLTALLLAERIGNIIKQDISSVGRRVVPVFWIASEDSDFEEVRHIDWLDQRGELQRFSYEPKGYRPGMPIFNVAVEASLGGFLEAVASGTFETEFRQGILAGLKKAIESSKNLEHFFARLMAMLFRGKGLVLISPRLKCMKRGAQNIFETEIRAAGTSSRLIRDAAETVKACGYKPTLRRREGDVNLFLLRDAVRCKVEFRKGLFNVLDPVSGKVLEKLTESQMLATLEETGETFCTNVVTRPLIQDAMLPTAAYVAGPGEISYYAQLGKVYDAFGVAMPCIYPRARVLLVEPRIERGLESLGCRADEIAAQGARALMKAALRSRKATQEEQKIARSIARIEAELESLTRALETSEPAVRKAGERTKALILSGLGKLRERSLEANKALDGNLTRQVRKIANSLVPYDKEQERVLNIFVPFLFNYGVDLMDFLRERISLDKTGIQPIYVSQIKGHGD
jgi:bacillithiol biosynthesis cysteine-adding enzyme BshC